MKKIRTMNRLITILNKSSLNTQRNSYLVLLLSLIKDPNQNKKENQKRKTKKKK